jgi:hypothetical protein
MLEEWRTGGGYYQGTRPENREPGKKSPFFIVTVITVIFVQEAVREYETNPNCHDSNP